MKSLNLLVAGLLASAVSIELGRAQEVVNRFNSAPEVSQWRYDFGGATRVDSWDPTQDANGNPASGSWKIDITFNSSLGGNNKLAETTDRWYPGLNGATNQSMDLDHKYDRVQD